MPGVILSSESVDVTADSQGRLSAVYVEIGQAVRSGRASEVFPLPDGSIVEMRPQSELSLRLWKNFNLQKLLP